MDPDCRAEEHRLCKRTFNLYFGNINVKILLKNSSVLVNDKVVKLPHAAHHIDMSKIHQYIQIEHKGECAFCANSLFAL